MRPYLGLLSTIQIVDHSLFSKAPSAQLQRRFAWWSIQKGLKYGEKILQVLYILS